MKRNFKFFCTMCLAGTMAFATSCKKNTEKQTVQVTLPSFEEVMGEPGEEDSKAYIDFNNGGAFKWSGEDDMIAIYNISNDGEGSQQSFWSAPASAAGKPTTAFEQNNETGYGEELGDRLDHYFIFYPAIKVLGQEFVKSTNTQTFDVPDQQFYTKVNGNPTVDPESMALATEVYRLNQSFTLDHIFGVCRLRLCGDGAVTKIELYDNVYALAGQVKMKLHAVNMNRFSSLMEAYTLANLDNLQSAYWTAWNEYRDELAYTPLDGATGVITLNCPTPVELSTTPTPFYISVRPGAFIKGFRIKVYTENNPNGTWITNYNHAQDSYCIKAGKITGFRPKDNAGNDIMIH